MMEIRVEDGVSIGKRRGGRPNVYAWPFDRMVTGQSFVVPRTHRKALQAAIARYEHRNRDTRFTIRSDENEVRCWRVE
jgi:hypothetical protein